MSSTDISGWHVAVTGAGGFLGNRLCEVLESRSVKVVRLGKSSGFRLLHDDLPEGLDHVFHLAGETGVPDSWKAPASFHLINTHGTVRMLDQCRLRNYGMSYAGAYVYGIPNHIPISEEARIDPNNPYAFSKWMGEEACAWFSRTYALPVTAIRLFNIYGRGQSDRFLITRIIEQTLDPSCGVIELMDLTPKRDYLYVDDAVDALIASVRKEGYAVYNVGSGDSYSVSEVVKTVFDVTGIRKEVRVVGEARRNEIPDVKADCSKIFRDTGWKPHRSLHQGIAEMLRGVE